MYRINRACFENMDVWFVLHEATNQTIDFKATRQGTLRAIEDAHADLIFFQDWINLTVSQRKMARTCGKYPYKTYPPVPCNLGWSAYVPAINSPEKKETDMYAIATNVNSTETDSQYQRNYLLNRARTAFHSLTEKGREDFGLNDMDRPNSAEELVTRIKEGKFTLGDTAKETGYFEDFMYNCIRWRDPAVKEDLEGFRAFAVLLDKAYADAKDAIIVQSPEDGLAAIKAMENMKTT